VQVGRLDLPARDPSSVQNSQTRPFEFALQVAFSSEYHLSPGVMLALYQERFRWVSNPLFDAW